MKAPFVSDLEPNKIVTASFLVQAKEIRQKKTGEPYLSLTLGDRTGEVDAKMWDNVAEVLDAFDRDDFVKVKGLVQIYHNRPQLTIHKIRPMAESEIDLADYFPASERDPDQMWAELLGFVGRMEHQYLRALLEAVLADEEIARRFRAAPAAKHIHHAYLGGLLEHVVSLCEMAKLAAGHYREIDADLLLTGVVLHDIGKIHELSYDRGFGYTSEGQLLGHMTIALHMVAEKIAGIAGFPPALRSLVEHMIISHHGQLEFGSPKLPQFPEALLLHYLDDLDSKLECMRSSIKRDRQVEGCFTGYVPSLERTVLKKTRYLNGAAAPAPAPPPAPAVAAAVAPVAPVEMAAHPLFTPKPAAASPFGDKLAQALAGKAEPQTEG